MSDILPELCRVEAVQDIWEDGEVALKGSVGTVVYAHDDGIGYVVEFTSPEHLVIGASRDELIKV